MLMHKELTEILNYDPATGIFTWAKARSNCIKQGQIAGTARADGRWVIRVGRLYLRSRLAFLYMKGRWPSEEIDHIDRNGANDAWVNLREASRNQNEANKSNDNRAMYRGVYHRPDKKTKQWAARIKIDGKEKYLGYFLTSKEAACVYDEAAKLEFGEFASLNFPSGV